MKKLLLLIALGLTACSNAAPKEPLETVQEQKPAQEEIEIIDSTDEKNLGIDNALKELELLDL